MESCLKYINKKFPNIDVRNSTVRTWAHFPSFCNIILAWQIIADSLHFVLSLSVAISSFLGSELGLQALRVVSSGGSLLWWTGAQSWQPGSWGHWHTQSISTSLAGHIFYCSSWSTPCFFAAGCYVSTGISCTSVCSIVLLYCVVPRFLSLYS